MTSNRTELGKAGVEWHMSVVPELIGRLRHEDQELEVRVYWVQFKASQPRLHETLKRKKKERKNCRQGGDV